VRYGNYAQGLKMLGSEMNPRWILILELDGSLNCFDSVMSFLAANARMCFRWHVDVARADRDDQTSERPREWQRDGGMQVLKTALMAVCLYYERSSSTIGRLELVIRLSLRYPHRAFGLFLPLAPQCIPTRFSTGRVEPLHPVPPTPDLPASSIPS
jgi:hypothetical protein